MTSYRRARRDLSRCRAEFASCRIHGACGADRESGGASTTALERAGVERLRDHRHARRVSRWSRCCWRRAACSAWCRITVAQRTAEFGTRMALGACAWDVVRPGRAAVARIGLLGLTVGLAGGVGVGFAMGSVLFGTSPADPATLGGRGRASGVGHVAGDRAARLAGVAHRSGDGACGRNKSKSIVMTILRWRI